MQLNPARGRKHTDCGFHLRTSKSWFMQLNPARGRKLATKYLDGITYIAVYAAQPREGTETITDLV